jgi:LssY-like putative type I secretion system component LssY
MVFTAEPFGAQFEPATESWRVIRRDEFPAKRDSTIRINGWDNMKRLKLWLQRLLVFALGVLTVWLITFVVFDAADQRLPLGLAVAVTYGLASYVILPRAIRIGLRILHRGRVPSYTLTGDGFPGDPVNLALIGTMRQLREAFAAAGWPEADPLGITSSWRMVRAFVLNMPYPTAPFSTLYLFGRGQDVGFQRSIDNSPRKRHHVRFWGLLLDRVEKRLDTPSFWLEAVRPKDDERVLWVGAGTKDIGFSLTRLSFQITHATDADTNQERDFIIEELLKCGAISNVRSHLPGERLDIGKVNRYVTDRLVAVAELSPSRV